MDIIKPLINWEDFEKIDIRVGTIIDVSEFPKAKKPAYKIQVDLGPLGIKKSSAQLCSLYKEEELLGKQVLAVVNFAPKQIANFLSECLILGIYGNNQDVILISPERKVENGWRLG